MPPQHIEVAETIAALKKALRREKEAPSDQPIYSATNRGNKLKAGANHVHAGALPYLHGLNGYRENVDHAGYTRRILERNPKRYNQYGYELNESESDTEADADAEDENPYSDIKLEELLCPLKHPSDLAMHPTLSTPFLDEALSEMLTSTETKLRQERVNLWRAKYLSRQCIGDESWMPCGSVETNEDWDLFEPKFPGLADQKSRKRKRNNEVDTIPNGTIEQDHALVTDESVAVSTMLEDPKAVEQETGKTKAKINGDRRQSRKAKSKADGILDVAEDVDVKDNSQPELNGVHDEENENNDLKGQNKQKEDMETKNDQEGASTEEATVDNTETQTEEQSINDEATTTSTPPPPTRRITRALAAETNPTNAPTTPPLSPSASISTITSSQLQPDALFLLPQSLSQGQRIPHILSQFGLPVEEILETRRLLTMYIQKQEEGVRGYEAVFAKLTKAKRMRDRLWEWCKAEGHVGEWSDGEDWIDAEAWGVTQTELKKGKDEEEVEITEEVGARKGKRRRNRE